MSIATYIKNHKSLSPGQKNQCFRFLENYGKEGIGICERYIDVVTGNVIVKTDSTKPALWQELQNLLTVRPGLTRKEIEKALNSNHISVLNCISKGLRKGRFIQMGNKYYAAR